MAKKCLTNVCKWNISKISFRQGKIVRNIAEWILEKQIHFVKWIAVSIFNLVVAWDGRIIIFSQFRKLNCQNDLWKMRKKHFSSPSNRKFKWNPFYLALSPTWKPLQDWTKVILIFIWHFISVSCVAFNISNSFGKWIISIQAWNGTKPKYETLQLLYAISFYLWWISFKIKRENMKQIIKHFFLDFFSSVFFSR